MLLGIDHLVIAVRDPDAAAEALERDTGLAPTGGGRHEVMGTFNRLAFLGDTYLELIGIFDRRLIESSVTFAVGNAALAVLDEGREGLATYALATDDVAGDASGLRAGGSPIGRPVAGSRTRPDGGVVRWATAFPSLGPAEPPFLIEHEYAGAEWGDEARATRAAFRHPVGGRVRVTALELPVAEPAVTAAAYAKVLGLAFDPGGQATVGPHDIRLRRSAAAEDGLRPSAAAEDGLPVVHLASEPGTPSLDLVRFGIRWVRASSDAGDGPG